MPLLAAAAESAHLAGDGVRARRLAEEVLEGRAEDADRAGALFVLGQLEEYTGTFVRARELLAAAADAATPRGGRLLLRILVELAGTCYLLDDQAGNWQAAARAAAQADETDPEQAMLAAYLSGAAYVFAGRPAEGAPLVVRALELLESEPSLRDDPRHLSLALLCARWLLDPGYQVGGVSVVDIGWRRIRSARSQGALGSLALGLSLAAGGLLWFGDHVQAYAVAGEAVELLDVLGFRAEPGVAHETLAMESAARGQHAEAAALLARATEGTRATGMGDRPPHLAFALIACALARGDLESVVELGEDQLRRNDGRGPMLEPLGVAPWLVEAYAGLGRDRDARALTDRYLEANAGTDHPYLVAMAARCQSLVAEDRRRRMGRSSGRWRCRPRWATASRPGTPGCCGGCGCAGPGSGWPPGSSSAPPRRTSPPSTTRRGRTGPPPSWPPPASGCAPGRRRPTRRSPRRRPGSPCSSPRAGPTGRWRRPCSSAPRPSSTISGRCCASAACGRGPSWPATSRLSDGRPPRAGPGRVRERWRTPR